jgi:hypothetical protein
MRKVLKGKVLQDFALSRGRKRMSVIIAPCRSAMRPIGSSAVFDVSASDRRALRADLKRLQLLERARAFKVLGEYALEVTPNQLRQLAAAGSVLAIRVNLWHRKMPRGCWRVSSELGHEVQAISTPRAEKRIVPPVSALSLASY